jgi:anti-sigma regulatory factor (Ser/Thr protein kinase)
MEPTPLCHHEFPILGRAYFLGGRASTSVKRVLGEVGVDPEVIQRICVACYEAEMNVVLHARSGHITLEVWDDRVEVAVVDQGPGIENITLALQPGWSSASEEARSLGFGAGMGLPNIRAQADDMQLDSVKGQGATMHLVFRREAAADE